MEKKLQKTLDKKQNIRYIITMNNTNKEYKTLHWIPAKIARYLLDHSMIDPSIDPWKMDLFSLCRALDQCFPDTLFFLVDNTEDERIEVLK